MRAAGFLVLLLLVACAHARRERLDVSQPPDPQDWGPHAGAPMEWWYASGSSPDQRFSFHWAFFHAPLPDSLRPLGIPLARLLPGSYAIAQVAVTDLEGGERFVREFTGFPIPQALPRAPPLRLAVQGARLVERPRGEAFDLEAGPLALSLAAEKPRTVHPPGWSGDALLGRLMYQSLTRLTFTGTWRGRPVSGLAWMDHQWGDQLPRRDARWDWHGLHLSDGSDVMAYELTRPDGSGRLLLATRTDEHGVTRELPAPVLEPLATWSSPGRRTYALGWSLRAGDLALRIRPLHLNQEVRSLTGVTFWEGPVTVEGDVAGRRVQGTGMGEHFPRPCTRQPRRGTPGAEPQAAP